MIVADTPVEADLLRLRHEFLSMPALRLTLQQVARLLDVRLSHASDLVTELERERFLVRDSNGAYCRLR